MAMARSHWAVRGACALLGDQLQGERRWRWIDVTGGQMWRGNPILV